MEQLQIPRYGCDNYGLHDTYRTDGWTGLPNRTTLSNDLAVDIYRHFACDVYPRDMVPDNQETQLS